MAINLRAVQGDPTKLLQVLTLLRAAGIQQQRATPAQSPLGKTFDTREGLAGIQDILKDPKAAKQFGLDESDYKLAVYEHDNMISDSYISDRAKAALADTKLVTRGYAGLKDGRVHTLIGKDGKQVWQGTPFTKTGFADDLQEGLKVMLPMALSFAPGMQALGAKLGGALGLSGTAATAVGTGLVNAGTAAATGARGTDILRAGLGGGAAAALPAIPGFSGLNPIAKAAISQGVSSGLTTGDGKAALLSALMGGAGASMTQAGVPKPVAGAATALLRTKLQGGNSQQMLLNALTGGASGYNTQLGSFLRAALALQQIPKKG